MRKSSKKRKSVRPAGKKKAKRMVTLPSPSTGATVHRLVDDMQSTRKQPAKLRLVNEFAQNERDPRVIDISPKNRSIAVGLYLEFKATRNHAPVDVYWDSSDPRIAKINNETGLAQAMSAGSVAITAAADEEVGSLVLTVIPAQLTRIELSQSSASIAAGTTAQFTATGHYTDHNSADLTSLVTWSSSDQSKATIDNINNKGQVRGLAATNSTPITITASYQGVLSTASLTVTPAQLTQIVVAPAAVSVAAGLQQQFTATGYYTDTSTQDLTSTVTWNSSDTTKATITTNGGLATGSSPTNSPIAITATYGGIVGASSLNVTPAVLNSITVTPATATVTPGQTQPFRAVGNYSDRTTPDITATVTWSSLYPGIATIQNPSGVATGVAVGSTTITASSNGISGTSTLTVPAPVVQSLVISSTRTSLGAGQTLQFLAVANYSDGSTKDVTAQASWQSSNPAIATFSNTGGLLTGMACGQTSISATFTDASGNQFTAPQQPLPPLVLNVVPNFTDLGKGDSDAFDNAKSRVNQLLTAFERRGNLSDAETGQLNDALELVTQYLNNNPGTPIPNFNVATKPGSSISDLQQLGITFNVDPSKGPIGTGSGKANVIDDRFRAIGDFLYGPPPIAVGNVSLEHDPGSFPYGGGPNPPGLTYDQMRMAAVYGYVGNKLGDPPAYKTLKFPVPASGDPYNTPVTPDDKNRRLLFNNVVEEADAHFRSNAALYQAVLSWLIQNSQAPKISVSDWAKVVVLLANQGVSTGDSNLPEEIRRALAAAQNAGQAAPPSQINIDLPDLDQEVSNFEIIKENIFALQPAYFCAMLEELKVFQVVEKLVELFQNGILPVVKGDAGNLLFDWWKNAALRVSEAERRGFYARALGFPGGDADSPNREFKDLFMRFVSAVSSFVRQNTVDNLLRSNIPGPISQQQVRKSGRDLATNISAHGYGIAYPMATELQQEVNNVLTILRNSEIQNAYGAKDVWQLVDQVAGLELGGAKNSVKYRTMASAGATVFAWLANKATQLSSSSYLPILDITQLQLPPTYTSKPTTDPSDFDLVGACDQWLAVTGTQEDSVEQAAQPVEAPVMPSRPIQIPSVARDMLESVGVPALAYGAAGQGKTNGSAAYNWRTK